MKHTRVLVTGATGFIAGHAIQELLRHGYAVRGSVRDLATADVAHLHASARALDGSLELVEARLDADVGWAEAVAGCTYVWHLASPVPAQAPGNDEEVIRPAVDGTLRVLRAAATSGTVRRLVMTSSIDAIRFGQHAADGHVWTEADWSDPERSDAYAKSKLYAEQAAWDFVGGTQLELVTINPGLVLGPLLHSERTTSLEVVRLLMTRAMPAVPRLGFSVVDVRDVAVAHRLAMEIPAVAGQRYITAGEHLWLGDIASILATEYAPRGYRVPTRPMPYWLMWLAARFDPTARRMLSLVGVPARVSSDKAQRELGWSTRAARESIVDAAESMVQFDTIGRPKGGTRALQIAAAPHALRLE